MTTPLSASESTPAGTAAASLSTELWSITVKVVGGIAPSSSPETASAPASNQTISLPNHIESSSAQRRGRYDSSDDEFSEMIASTDAVISEDDEISEAPSVAAASPPKKPDVRNAGGERIFTVQVSPENSVTVLHEKITSATGLALGQQRLIYRGRLIGKSDTDEAQGGLTKGVKIGEIPGLADGQTIHLVKKREMNRSSTGNNNGSGSNNTEQSSVGRPMGSPAGLEGGGFLFGSTGGSSDDASSSLIAALLGFGGLGEALNSASSGNNDDSGNGLDTTRRRVRASRMSPRNRRPPYRLTELDLEVPDPGTMEPVRQGLMTLHTMIPHAQIQGNGATDSPRDPLQANRQWYQGQWLDCRDTVNQWLEATVVEVVRPDDILMPTDIAPPLSSTEPSDPHTRQSTELTNDPAIGAHDMEGRRRLLLERIEYDQEEENDERPQYRQRSNNEGVQLLLIHYNGWPHRWDEWIRSDSERIRPFRTRTRHPSMSSTACPTPQSVFSESPRTNIRDGDESDDRAALLPELSRALSTVNDLLSRIAQPAAAETQQDNQTNLTRQRPDLPWVQQPNYVVPSGSSEDENKYDSDSSDDDGVPDLLTGDGEIVLLDNAPEAPDTQAPLAPPYNRRQLELLAPVLDRLGRTLTDAAPHVARFAASLPEENISEANNDSNEEADLPELEYDQLPVGVRAPPDDIASVPRAVEPDHMDYASGLVNTSRGEVRNGPRGRSRQSDDVSNLLGAYLTAATLGGLDRGDNGGGGDGGNGLQGLGRILRDRGTGGGGGGIDIHIHAVVSPGTDGGPGFMFGTENAATSNGGDTGGLRGQLLRDSSRGSGSLLVARNSMVSTSAREDEGLFSELYSENPTPLDHIGNPESSEDSIATENFADAEESEESTVSTDDPYHLARAVAPNSSPRITSRSTASSPLHHSSRHESDSNESSNSSGGSQSSPRRSSRGWGRLFGRRRSSRNNN